MVIARVFLRGASQTHLLLRGNVVIITIAVFSPVPDVVVSINELIRRRFDKLQLLNGPEAMEKIQTLLVVFKVTLMDIFPIFTQPTKVDFQDLSKVHGAPLFVDFPIMIVQVNIMGGTIGASIRSGLVTFGDTDNPQT